MIDSQHAALGSKRFGILRLFLALTVALACLVSGPQAAAKKKKPEKKVDEPRILVPPIVGIDRNLAVDSHPKLVAAFRKKFGKRLVDSADIIDAQKRLRVWPQQLLTPEGVAQLATETGAERAVIVAATRRGVVALVYAVIGEKATRSIAIPGIKPKKLTRKAAAKIARVVEKRGKFLLENRSAPEVVAVDLGEMSIGDADEPETDNQFNTLGITVTTGPPSDDIQEEEKREAEALEALLAGRHRLPAVALAAGFGLATRQTDIAGSQSKYIVPVDTGTVPTWSLYAAVSPLKLIPSLNRSSLADLLLDVHFRRGIASATYGDVEVPVEDDDLVARLSYRLPLLHHSYSPSFGLGLGGGWERTEFVTGLATPSTRYLFVESHARLVQPLWAPLLRLEGTLGVRRVVGGEQTVNMGPAWQGELWLVAHVAPVFYSRLGVRNSVFTGWRDTSFSMTDRTTQFEFELGGYF